MKAAMLSALLLAATAAPAAAQYVTSPPPAPLPLGIPYAYQPGNPYWFAPVYPQPSPYPFGATGPVFGRYTWDYSGYRRTGLGYDYTTFPSHAYPYPAWYSYPSFYPPTVPGRTWMGFGR